MKAMLNFDYNTPTRVFFGKGRIEVLPEELGRLGKKVLLVTGGGSVKRIGLYDKVKALLGGFEVFELGGVEPNPKLSSVEAGAAICKREGVDVVLALGGGSVLDCSKAIAAAACHDCEPWALITHAVPTERALPIADVITLAATGSEYDCAAVISNPATNDKIGYLDPHIYPTVSVLDPEYTESVPASQTAAGAADIMSHVLEQFFTDDSNFLADQLCESVLKTVIKYAPVAVAEPDNFEARAQLMWASSLACNNILSLGNSYSGWPCHAMEHTLSAYYDITHGVGLAILTPRYFKHILSEKTLPRFVEYGKNVWGIDPHLGDREIADRAIGMTSRFLKSLGIPMNLKAVGIDQSRIAEMAAHTCKDGRLARAPFPLSEKDVKAIYKSSL